MSALENCVFIITRIASTRKHSPHSLVLVRLKNLIMSEEFLTEILDPVRAVLEATLGCKRKVRKVWPDQ